MTYHGIPPGLIFDDTRGWMTADDAFPHIPNREALGAADNLEAFTPAHRTAKEVVANHCASLGMLDDFKSKRSAEDLISSLRAAGYDIVHRVSQGDKPWPPK